MSYVPQPYREIDLLMRGSEQTAGVAQAVQRQKRVHPILEQILREYGAKLASGEITAEEVHEETAKRLRAYGAQTEQVAPPSGASTGNVPVAQPAKGDIPSQPGVPVQAAPVQSGAAPGGAPGASGPSLGTPNQMPAQAPGTGPSLATPMQQASGVASSMMNGQPQAPRVATPSSVGALATAADAPVDGPTLTIQPPQASRKPTYKNDRPFTSEDIEDFNKAAPFINYAQRPEIETKKIEGKKQVAKVTADARMSLEQFKQRNQNSRMAAKLDSAMTLAQGRLDMDGQKTVAHMAEVLLVLNERLQQAREEMAQRMAAKQGDWKVAVQGIQKGVLISSRELIGKIGGSINYIADPLIQETMRDAMSQAERDMDDFQRLNVEIGTERGSDALANPPSLTGEKPKPAGEVAKPAETPMPSAPTTDVSKMADPFKTASDATKSKKKTTKKVTPAAKSLLDEVYGK